MTGPHLSYAGIDFDLPCLDFDGRGVVDVDVADDGSFTADFQISDAPISTFAGTIHSDGTSSGTLIVNGDDGAGNSCTTGELTWTAPLAAPPVAFDSAVATPFETPVDFTLTATDVNGDPLDYFVDDIDGIGGTVTCGPRYGPDCTYTPPAGRWGDALISFVATDHKGGDGNSNTATVTVTVGQPVVDSIKVTSSATTVDQGGSVTLTATGFSAGGVEIGDVTADVEFKSDVGTDDVQGNEVEFLHASPHTITGTHTSGAQDRVTINVIPTAAPTDPDDLTPSAPADGGPSLNTGRVLPDTGGTPLTLVWLGCLLLMTGGGALWLARGHHRTRQP